MMRRSVKKIAYTLHLWLGLLTGIILFIVCITGCLYVFKDEINDATQPWRFVQPQEKVPLYPSQVIAIADKALDHKLQPSAITYNESRDALVVDYGDMKSLSTVYVNPYDGTILKVIDHQDQKADFFSFVLEGHRHLWLPPEIGKPMVGWSVLLFIIILITGLILWWPKSWNKKTIRQRMTIKWKASFGRVSFDLHNILGGWAFVVLIIVAFTGLIWSFGWFSDSVYYLTSGGEKLKPYTLPTSDTLHTESVISQPLDKLYLQLRMEEPDAKTWYFALPKTKSDVIRVSVVHKNNAFYKTDNLFFDQYTLTPLSGEGPYAGKYREAKAADKLRRMNLDIHDGRILGLAGKILVFLAALIGASLPVTGVILWLRKQRRRGKNRD